MKLGHARGVALLAAVEAGIPVVEYTPAEIKRAVVGFGRAEKHQIQQMVKLLLGLDVAPSPHDVADALAVAFCHLNTGTGPIANRVGAETARLDGPILARIPAVIARLRGTSSRKARTA